MKTSTLSVAIALTAAAAVVVALTWLDWRPTEPPTPAPNLAAEAGAASPEDLRSREPAPVTRAGPTHAPPAAPSAGGAGGKVEHSRSGLSWRSALEEIADLRAPAGRLGWDEARALMERRRAREKAMVDELAAAWPGDSRSLTALYRKSAGTSERRFLIQVLAASGSPQAVAVLRDLLLEEKTFSLQREVVAALGQREEGEAVAALGDVLRDGEDARLRFAAAQALTGKPDGIPALVAAIESDADEKVRIEAVHALGEGREPVAREALARIGRDGGKPAVREHALQELARAFPSEAPAILEPFLGDPEPRIRSAAERGIRKARLQPASE